MSLKEEGLEPHHFQATSDVGDTEMKEAEKEHEEGVFQKNFINFMIFPISC